jgi:hypothetical protein
MRFAASQIEALNFRTGIVDLRASAKGAGVAFSMRLESKPTVGRQCGV